MLRYLSGVLSIVLILAAGCASQRKINNLSLQMSVIEQQNKAIEEKLIEVDSVGMELLEALRVFTARSEFVEKTGDALLEETDAKLNDLLDRLERLQQSVASLQQGLVKAPLPESGDSSIDSTQTGISYVDARKLYDTAFKDLTAGDYQLAILGFNEYIETFPNTDLTDDAQFWIGECYYRQKDYSSAEKEFSKIETGYPNSDKMASVLYKLGRCCEETGNGKKAKEYFKSTVEKYPGTPEAELAKDKLKASGG